MPVVHLNDRALLSVSGADAEPFLQNLITTDLAKLNDGKARPSALLSPQGKVLFDFLISRDGSGGFTIDISRSLAAGFRQRLMLYRLRAKVDISEPMESVVAVSWENDSGTGEGETAWMADLRFPSDARVRRRYADVPKADADEEEWHRIRIANGVAESGHDFAAGDAFPHDLLYDFNGGVGLRKGCFVGQEVVSRMQHRGTARRRVLVVEGDAALPAPGTAIEADGRSIGSLGTTSGRDGLAIIRIDRAKAAMDRQVPIKAGDAELSLTIPGWAAFGFPETASDAEEP